MGLRLFVENADLAYVLEAMPVCSVSWRDAVYARVGGPHAYLALLSPSAAAPHRITADDHVMALARAHVSCDRADATLRSATAGSSYSSTAMRTFRAKRACASTAVVTCTVQ